MTDTSPAQPKKGKPWGLIFFGVFIVLPVTLFLGYTWVALHYVFSDGEKAGYIQKFSKKGWIFKTWEGEMAIVNLPGTAPEVFKFTARDEQAIKEVEQYMGKRVSLHYQQHRGIPGTIFGETPYFVVGARSIDDISFPNTGTPPQPH